MNELLGGLGLLLLGAIGWLLNKRSHEAKAPKKSEEVLDDFSEKASEAGVDLADSMALDTEARSRKVLDWLRKRNSGSPD